ncbi:MAG TPA: hypothetical protein VN023_00995 [Methylovorus sp.]|jgi:hypothetical protein|nr:hypothetical protein [Methylovorus sp.]
MRNHSLMKFRHIRYSPRELAPDSSIPQEGLTGTLADYAHHMGVSTRQRLRLIAKGVFQEIRSSAHQGSVMAGRAAGRVKARLAHGAARRLIKLADRLERKATRNK